IQGRIQPQAGEQAHVRRITDLLEQLDHRIGTIRYHHQLSSWQPTVNQANELASPLRQWLVALPSLLMIALRGTQEREKWQSPYPLGPRNFGKHHRTEPSNPTGLDRKKVCKGRG